MPNIMLKKSSISAISRQIEKMCSETAAAEKKIRSSLGDLDFEVASKHKITDSLNGLITSANRQGSLSERYKSTFLNVTDSFENTDLKHGNKSGDIFRNINMFLDGNGKRLSDFFIRNKLKKINEVSGLFVTSSVTAFGFGNNKLFGRISDFFKWLFGSKSKKDNPNGGTCPPSEEEKKRQEEAKKRREEMDKVDSQYDEKLKRLGYTDEEIRDARDDSANAAELEEKYNQMIDSAPIKVYEGSSKDISKGGYSDYNVVKGFDEKYVYCQKNSDNSDFRANGCVSTSDAMVGAMAKGHDVNPEITFVNGKTTWGNAQTDAIPGSKTWSAERRYTEMYNQINRGNAVVIRVTSKTAPGHSMVAIGVKNGCDPNNMSAADVLIADPATGQISNLQEYFEAYGGRLVNDWSLLIDKTKL